MLHVLEANSCGKCTARTVLFSAFVACSLAKGILLVIQEATSLPTGRATAFDCAHHMFSVAKSMYI